MGRATPRQQAANIRRAEQSIAKSIERDTRRALARGIQEFAVRSMNNLAQAGPAWTGEFSQSWVFVPEGGSAQSPTAGAKNGIGKYNKNDVPVREVERYLKDGKTRFQIANTSEHALIAIDAQESKFAPPPSPPAPIDPVKVPVAYGTGRPKREHFRWEMRNTEGEEITSQITAGQDWFPNYLDGGQLQEDLKSGVRAGFSSNQL
jgi:hypothetical protein